MLDFSPQYVHTPAALKPLLTAVENCDRVGLDTEFVSEGTYEPILCLVQIATAEGIWIVDPLAVSDLRPLWLLLTEPDRLVIALAAREEIRFCIRGADRPPPRVFDPQVAAGLVGYGYPLSHTNLVRKVLGVRVAGGESFTDWRRRPLTDKQVEYAADDVRHLLALEQHLMADADQRGRREWVELECAKLLDRVTNGAQEERWMRVSGSGNLQRRELAVLRELWRWRDQEARRTNQPSRRVLRDEMLIEIAKRRPASVNDLFELRGLERGSVRSAGPAIVGAVERALALPPSEYPESLRRDDPPQVAVLGQLLSVAANSLAEEHEVDPALLATSSDLQDLVRWKLGLLPQDPEPPVLQGWRGEILGHSLLELLEGKRTLRVGDLGRRYPLVFEPRTL